MHRTLRAGVAAVALTLIPVCRRGRRAVRQPHAQQGTSGSDVEALQRYLDDAGYDTTADGEFGPAHGAQRAPLRDAPSSARSDGKATRSNSGWCASRADEDGEPRARSPASRPRTPTSTTRVSPSRPPPRRPRSRRSSRRATRSPPSPTSTAAATAACADSGYDCSGSVSYALHGAGLLDIAARLHRLH